MMKSQTYNLLNWKHKDLNFFSIKTQTSTQYKVVAIHLSYLFNEYSTLANFPMYCIVLNMFVFDTTLVKWLVE